MDTPHFRHTSEVAFGETDASGWMHFPNILAHVERAEHAFLRTRGVRVFDRAMGGGWPRARVECDFKIPLEFGDVVIIELTITRFGATSLTWKFDVLNASGKLAATGTMTTVRVGGDGCPCEIPAEERAALNIEP